jgi:hypothetical protein
MTSTSILDLKEIKRKPIQIRSLHKEEAKSSAHFSVKTDFKALETKRSQGYSLA